VPSDQSTLVDPPRSRGQIVDDSGAPIAGITVSLVTNMGVWELGASSADGSYDVPCVPPEDSFSGTSDMVFHLLLSGQPSRTFQLGDPALNYAYTYVGGTSDLSTAPPVPCLTADEPAVVTTMHPGAILTGHIYNPDGQPAAVVQYWVTPPDGPSPCICNVGFPLLGQDGSYRVVGLATGDYDVEASGGSNGSAHIHLDAGTTLDRDIWWGTPNLDPPTTSTTAGSSAP
jgi:hypothetical protein